MKAARFHGSVSPRATIPLQPSIDGVRNFEYAINQHNPEQRDLIAHKQFLRVQRRIPPRAIGRNYKHGSVAHAAEDWQVAALWTRREQEVLKHAAEFGRRSSLIGILLRDGLAK